MEENNNDFLSEICKPESQEKVLPTEFLNEEQKKLVLNEFERQNGKASIEDLCDAAWPGLNLDGRTKHGREIKKLLSEKDLKAKSKGGIREKTVVLTDEQKEYIKNNPNMKAIEIAPILFERPFVSNVSQEVKTIYAYQMELVANTQFRKEVDEPEPMGKYNPPNSLDKCCARINKYMRDANYDYKNLSSLQKKQCLTLISNLYSYRLTYQINSYTRIEDRELFESTFISYCYDKPDLTREDCDKTIILATEAVIAANKLRTIEMLQTEQERTIAENGKVSMAIVEAINTATTEYNASVKRQQSLYNDLNEKRSEKLKGKMKEAATVLNLVEIWKQEEKRNKMLKIANQRRTKIKEEIDRLDSMDDLIVQIVGLSEEEALN